MLQLLLPLHLVVHFSREAKRIHAGRAAKQELFISVVTFATTEFLGNFVQFLAHGVAAPTFHLSRIKLL